MKVRNRLLISFVFLLGGFGYFPAVSAQTCTPAGGFATGTGPITTTTGDSSCFDRAFSIGDNVTMSGLIIGNSYTVSTCGEAAPSNHPHPSNSYLGLWNAAGTIFISEALGGACGDGNDERLTFTATATSHLVIIRTEACGTGFQFADLCVVNNGPTGPSCTVGTFTTQPMNATVCPNASHTFSADTTGGGGTIDSLRWQLSTNGGATWSLLFNGAPYSGVTTLALNINPATVGLNNNRYRCVVYGCSNPDSTVSNQAILTVADNLPPNITCPANQTQVLNASCQTPLADYTGSATISDNCDPSPSVSQNPAAGTILSGHGTNITVSLIGTDASANSATCTFTVTAVDQTPPSITCPANQTLVVNGSCQASLPDYSGSATVSDNCDPNPSVTQSPVPGTTISGAGTNVTVSLFAQDAASNGATCTFTVTTQDTTSPTISCPPTQVLNLDNSCSAALPDYTSLATANDNCGSVTVTQSPAPSTVVSGVGTMTVTLTATDGSANTASCTFTVDKRDITDPSITCPANQTLFVNGVCQASLPDYTSAATVSDNCDPNPSVTQSPTPGTTLTGAGVNVTVSLFATDASSNGATCTFTVTTADSTSPTVSCPGPQTLMLNASCQASLPDYRSMATGMDNCGTPTLTQSPAPGTTVSGGGLMTVTITATDGSSNTSSCTFTVNKIDNVPPTITCPGTQTLALNASCQASLPDYTSLANANDNCGPPTVTQNPAAGTTVSGVGTMSVTLYATDGSGNVDSCSFTVNKVDVTDPSITCPANQTLFVDGSCQASLPDYTSSATVSDNCDPNPSVTQSPASGTTISGAGTNVTVSLFATDASANGATCTFTVTTADSTSPTVTCPGTQTLALNASCEASLPDYRSLATGADNCGTPILTQSPAPGTIVSGSGNLTVTITATDASTNTGSCTFTVTKVDNTAPSITCPATQTLNLNASCQAILPDYTSLASASDNCGAPTVTQNPASGTTVSGAGSMSVTLIATDGAGNVDSCSFTVNKADISAPSITCPANQTLPVDGSCQASLPDYTSSATVSDNCDPNPSVTQTPASGSTITGAGTSITVSLFASDASSNGATCTFTVTTTDTTRPSITCPGTQVLNLNANCEATLPDYTSMGSTSDNCDANPVITQNPAPGTTVSGVGTMNVWLISTDASGNVDSCSFVVGKFDITAPSITCPGNQTLNVDANCMVMLPDYTGMATVSDNCDPNPTVTQSPAAGTMISGAGTNVTVTLTATDITSNANSCSFTVTTRDTIPPVITCPANDTVLLDGNCQAALADYTGMATTTDNCTASPTVTQSPAPATVISGATNTTVTLVSNDGNGNVDSCSFVVTTVDSTPPTPVCNNITVQLDGNGMASIQPGDVDGGSSDNCGPFSSSVSPNSFNCGDVGANTVVLILTDVASNEDSCTATVMVMDTVPPVVLCMDTTVMLDTTGNVTIDSSFVINSISDACGIASATVSPSSFNCGNAGPNTVTLTVTDVNGNVSTCTAIVTVTGPTFSVSLTTTTNVCGFNINCSGDSTGTATAVANSACTPITYNWSHGASGATVSNLWAGTFVVTATDASGAMAIDSITLDEPPMLNVSDISDSILCVGDKSGFIDLVVSGGNACMAYTFIWNTGDTSEDLMNVGPGFYTVTVIDAGGCSAVHGVNIAAYPASMVNIGPDTMLCEGDSLMLNATPGGFVSYLWDNGDTGQSTVVSDSGFHWVVAVDTNGCVVRDSMELILNAKPTPVIQPGPVVALCVGDSVTLDVQSGYFSHLWNTGDTSQAILVTGPGDFVVTVTNGFGCLGISDTVTVDTVSLPAPIITKSNDSLLASMNFATYQWFEGGNAIAGAINFFFVPTQDGTYYVEVTDFNGCSGRSNSIDCELVGVAENLLDLYGLSLFPNPARNVFHLKSLRPLNKRFTVQVRDLYGRSLQQWELPNLDGEAEFAISGLSAGTYIVELTTVKGERVVFRLAVQ